MIINLHWRRTLPSDAKHPSAVLSSLGLTDRVRSIPLGQIPSATPVAVIPKAGDTNGSSAALQKLLIVPPISPLSFFGHTPQSILRPQPGKSRLQAPTSGSWNR